jgi:hypothetical protein
MALAHARRWSDGMKGHKAVERLEYIEAVQQGREKEEHGIQMVGKSSLDRMKNQPNTGLRCLGTHTEKSKSNGPSARSTGIKLIK